ncbi:MAG: hypothetical protein IPK83_06920 [Planctomycetes bacterium]|nr:hypothetical protein [Planctomycetota bacterium]
MTKRNSRPHTLGLRLLALAIALPLLGAECPPTSNNNNANANGNQNANNNNQSNSNTSADDLPFTELTGTERMVELIREGIGTDNSRMRDEEFTATYTLTPTTFDTRDIFINNQPSTAIFGDITGMAHCTYEESGTDIDTTLMCATTSYDGSVEWDTQITGSYDYFPALGTVTLTLHATDVSSPEYIVTFSTPGCPELDSMDPRNYAWQGPGQGVWGFVDIVLENGHFEDRVENPLDDERGAADFFEIEING